MSIGGVGLGVQFNNRNGNWLLRLEARNRMYVLGARFPSFIIPKQWKRLNGISCFFSSFFELTIVFIFFILFHGSIF